MSEYICLGRLFVAKTLRTSMESIKGASGVISAMRNVMGVFMGAV